MIQMLLECFMLAPFGFDAFSWMFDPALTQVHLMVLMDEEMF